MFETYPWQEKLWLQIVERARNGTLPHALLLTGGNGIGKRDFAVRFGQLLLCESFQNSSGGGEVTLPCGHCHGCRLNQVATHPDLKIVEPQSEGKVISIDQIRELSEFLGLKSHYGNVQVAVIFPAEKMNRFAANSLLKTLEEPTSSTHILLVTSQPSALLPTIRSRCQQIPFPPPATESALEWLKSKAGKVGESEVNAMLRLANGAPLEALEYLRNDTRKLVEAVLASFAKVTSGEADPVTVAKVWSEADVRLLIKWLILWTSYMITLKSAGQAPDSDFVGVSVLQRLAAKVDLQSLFQLLDKLTETRRLLDSQANVTLLLEDLLILWLQLNSQKSRSQRSRRSMG
jgi:DNA polymerase-3 subunit delta'